MAKILILAIISLALTFTSCYKPIIAIFGNSYPATDFIENKYDFVQGSYVSWVQESGGEVLVIHPWHSDEEVDTILSKVNGVLFQGGDRDFDLSSRWETLAARIIKKSIEYHQKNEIFPIWGTCQGFQLILTLMANEKILDNYNDWIKLHKVIFNNLTRTSRIYSLFKEADFDLLENHDSTIYFHHYGVTEEKFNSFDNLINFLDITSLGEDDDKKHFINSFEGKNGLPIYGVQYHPEKNPYIRQNNYTLEHNTDARKVSQLLSLFFLTESRKSTHRMEESERRKYNFITSFSQSNFDRYDDNYYYFSKKN